MAKYRPTSVIVPYVVVLSVRVVVMLIELVNLHTLLLVRLIVLQISVNHLNSLPLIHILLIPAHLRSVLLVVIAIFPVNVSCVSVTSSSFFNSANSHDIASKLIVGRDRINVLTKPGDYYLQYFFSQHYFGSF